MWKLKLLLANFIRLRNQRGPYVALKLSYHNQITSLTENCDSGILFAVDILKTVWQSLKFWRRGSDTIIIVRHSCGIVSSCLHPKWLPPLHWFGFNRQFTFICEIVQTFVNTRGTQKKKNNFGMKSSRCTHCKKTFVAPLLNDKISISSIVESSRQFTKYVWFPCEMQFLTLF